MTYPVLYTLGTIYSEISDNDKLIELIKTAEESGKCQPRTLEALKSL